MSAYSLAATVAALVGGAAALKLLLSRFKKKPFQGPPPTTLVVYGGAQLPPDPDCSPACIKLMAFLRLAKVDYKYVPYGEHQGAGIPKGKIPYAWGEALGVAGAVGDSQLIIEALQARGAGKGLDDWLTPEQAATGTALRVMLEESVYWGILAVRWLGEGFWPITVPLVLGSVPAPIRPLLAASIRRRVRASLHLQGFGRHTDAERTRLTLAQLQAASTLLGDNKYLFGDRPCSVDASLYAFVAAAVQGGWSHPILDGVRTGMPNLVAYRDRMAKELFPELQK